MVVKAKHNFLMTSEYQLDSSKPLRFNLLRFSLLVPEHSCTLGCVRGLRGKYLIPCSSQAQASHSAHL